MSVSCSEPDDSIDAPQKYSSIVAPYLKEMSSNLRPSRFFVAEGLGNKPTRLACGLGHKRRPTAIFLTRFDRPSAGQRRLRGACQHAPRHTRNLSRLLPAGNRSAGRDVRNSCVPKVWVLLKLRWRFGGDSVEQNPSAGSLLMSGLDAMESWHDLPQARSGHVAAGERAWF